MGIDIFAHRRDQTDSIGYLRESYHGGPYATRELMPESWDLSQARQYAPGGGLALCEYDLENEDGDPACSGVPIAAALLIERLPRAVLAKLTRLATVYDDGDARAFLAREVYVEATTGKPLAREIQVTGEGGAALPAMLGGIFAHIATVQQPQDVADVTLTPEQIARAVLQFDAVAGLVDFVAACVQAEMETGEPCLIANSY